eukprot:1144006-Pelagomonas_calceolata.AAC.1
MVGHFIRNTFWGVRGARAGVQKIARGTSILAGKWQGVARSKGFLYTGRNRVEMVDCFNKSKLIKPLMAQIMLG